MPLVPVIPVVPAVLFKLLKLGARSITDFDRARGGLQPIRRKLHVV